MFNSCGKLLHWNQIEMRDGTVEHFPGCPGTPTWSRWGWPGCQSTRRGTWGTRACRGVGRARWSSPRAPRPESCLVILKGTRVLTIWGGNSKVKYVVFIWKKDLDQELFHQIYWDFSLLLPTYIMHKYFPHQMESIIKWTRAKGVDSPRFSEKEWPSIT